MENALDSTEKDPAPTLLNHALKFGLITGAISVLLLVLLYVIDYGLMVELKFLLISMAIYIGITIYAGIDYRKQIGGFLPYGKAFGHGWLLLMISGVCYTAFAAILYNVIDPELPGKLLDVAMDNQREMMENFGAPPDRVEAELEKAKGRMENQFTIGGQLLGLGMFAIFYAIIASITAAIVKRNEPVSM